MQDASQIYWMVDHRDALLRVTDETIGDGVGTNHTYWRAQQRSVAIAVVALIHSVVVATLSGGRGG